MKSISFGRHRFPPVIIQHAIWLSFRFSLSYRPLGREVRNGIRETAAGEATEDEFDLAYR